MVLLRLRVEQLGVEGGAEERGIDGLALGRVVGGEEVVEVGAAGRVDVEGVGRDVAALGPKVRRVVLREGLLGLQEAAVEGRLLGVLLGLRGGQVLGGVEAGAGSRGLEGG